jgi:hypothetical protein
MELDRSSYENVYDAVTEMRQNWLNPAPAVFVEMACAEISCLRWLDLHQVEEIRLLGQDNTELTWPQTQQDKVVVVMLRTREMNPNSDPTNR